MKFLAYGIEVHSPLLLPLLIPSEGKADQVLRLSIIKIPGREKVLEYQTPIAKIHGRETRLSSNISLSLSRILDERCWRINIEGLFTFSWCNDSNYMTVEHETKLDLHKLSFWLLHTIIPVYLILKQSSILLHASAIEVEKKSLLFIAPSFGGKSTLVDFFAKQKHALISDDKVRLQFEENDYFAFPSYPYRRPYRKFEALGDHTDYFADNPLPIDGIYVLNYVEPKSHCNIESIYGLHKFEILKNAYLYEPVSMSKVEMQYLMNLVKNSFLYQVNIPKDITRLADVYQTIVNHVKREL